MNRTGLAGLVVLLAACGGTDTPPTASRPAPTTPAAAEAGGMSEAGGYVCDDFARYIKAGQPVDQRPEVVSKIGGLIGNAEPGLQDAYGTLTRSVEAPASQWRIAADTFAQACFDAGWNG